MLYSNLGRREFVEISRPTGVNDGGWGWGTVAVDLDQDERVCLRPIGVHLSVDCLYQRRFAHPPRAPQQGVVGRQALGEAAGVFIKDIGLAIDALQQAEGNTVDLCDRHQLAAFRAPDEGLGALQPPDRRWRRGEPFERARDAVQQLLHSIGRALSHLALRAAAP